MSRRCTAVPLVLLFVVLACSALAASPTYRIRDLSSVLPMFPDTCDMSASGQLAGSFGAADGKQHAFRWSWSGGLVDLGIYGGGSCSGAKSINASGWVAGYSYVADGDQQHAHAMLWRPDGAPVHLDMLPGAQSSVALSINDPGQVLGVSTLVVGDHYGLPIYEYRLTVWEPDGSVRDLGVQPLGGACGVQAISNSSRILGFSLEGGARKLWLRTINGETTYLDTTGSDWAEADDLNAYEVVTGSAGGAYSTGRAVVWGPDGSVLRRLPPLAGLEGSMAYGINDSGFVVGESSLRGSSGDFEQIRATLWTPDGTAIALDSLPGFEISRARRISNDGWIVGEVGIYGDWRTVIWEPVPELSPALVMITGLLALAPLRRRWC